LAIRQTPPLVHRHLIPRHTAAEFRQKPGLAYARFADQAHHLTLSSDRRRQVVMEQRQLPLSAYKRTPSPRTPPCHASVQPQGSLHRVHRRRGGRPVQREGLVGCGPDLCMHQRIGRRAQQDCPRRGLLLEPCRHVEWCTDCRGQPLPVVPQTTHDHQARV
jgi:hypothetical protein